MLAAHGRKLVDKIPRDLLWDIKLMLNLKWSVLHTSQLRQDWKTACSLQSAIITVSSRLKYWIPPAPLRPAPRSSPMPISLLASQARYANIDTQKKGENKTSDHFVAVHRCAQGGSSVRRAKFRPSNVTNKIIGSPYLKEVATAAGRDVAAVLPHFSDCDPYRGAHYSALLHWGQAG